MCLGDWSMLGLVEDADIKAVVRLPDVIDDDDLEWDLCWVRPTSSFQIFIKFVVLYIQWHSKLITTLTATLAGFATLDNPTKPLPIPTKNPNPHRGSGYSRVGVRVTPETPRGYPCPSLHCMGVKIVVIKRYILPRVSTWTRKTSTIIIPLRGHLLEKQVKVKRESEFKESC